MTTDLYAPTDVTKKYPGPPFPEHKQDGVGTIADMDPVPDFFTADDVMLCIRLVASALTETSRDERDALVRRSWQLLGVRLPE